MGAFNYNQFRLFDKNGHELMLHYTNHITLKLLNERFPEESSEYALIFGTGGTSSSDMKNVTLMKTKTGSRYMVNENGSWRNITINDSISVIVNGEEPAISIGKAYFEPITYKSSNGNETVPEIQYNNGIKFNDWSNQKKEAFLSRLGISLGDFPTSTFEANLRFEKVSTGLVETQSLYVLVDDPSTNMLVDVSTYGKGKPRADGVNTFINDYTLFFFIDCREQSDFRFFTTGLYTETKQPEASTYFETSVEWSDRRFMKFENGSIPGPDNGYRVDIGFSGENEGVYEDKVYVCLCEKEWNSGHTAYENGDVHIIGTINLFAETEGKDERYDTLFTNFGLPDMDETEKVFADTNSLDELPDYRTINKHAKKIFLEYSDIFPYAGSYKALFKAIKLLGYDDIFFKEWYKELGNSNNSERGFIAFDVTDESSKNKNTISNKSIDERLHLRKLNWISMMYNLNKEVNDKSDMFGFPTTITNENYYSTDNIPKLISIKNWLEKYIIGVNARIIDIGGEGIVFERYGLAKYGTHQQVFDYVNEKSVTISIDSNASAIYDGSGRIGVSISTSSENGMIEDFKNKRFIDFALGKFEKSGNNWTYDNVGSSEVDDPSTVYFGKCIELHDPMNTIELRALGDIDSLRLEPRISQDDKRSLLCSNTTELIISDGMLWFDPQTNQKEMNTVFEELPIIEIRDGYIKPYVFPHGTCTNPDEDFGGYKIYTTDNGTTKVVPDRRPEITINNKQAWKLIPPKTEVSEDDENVVTFTTFDGSTYTLSFRTTQNPDYEKTYGLRYTSVTHSGTSEFLMFGYSSFDTLDLGKILPKRWAEYVLFINDGCMYFTDPKNNRQIMLKFYTEDGIRKVKPFVLQYSEQFTLYSYKISNSQSVNRFQVGEKYNYFLNGYINNPETVITDNTEGGIRVTNAGTYKVSASLYDEYNNTFTKTLDSSFTVYAPDIDASTYANINATYDTEQGSRDESGTNINELVTDSSFLYGYFDKFRIINKTIDGSNKIITLQNPDATSSLYYSGLQKTQKGDHIWNTNMKNRCLYSACEDDTVTLVPLFDVDLLTANRDDPVNVIIFDRLTEYPVYILSGIYLSFDDPPFDNKITIRIDMDTIPEGESIEDIFNTDYDIFIVPSWERNIADVAIDSSHIERLCFANYIWLVTGNNYKIKTRLSDVSIGQSLVTITRRITTPTPSEFDSQYEINRRLTGGMYSLSERQTKITPATTTFFGASLELSEDSSFANRVLIVEQDPKYLELADYIDKEFVSEYRNFDLENGYIMWPEIPQDEKYGFNCPIKTSERNIFVAPKIERTGLDKSDIAFVHWIVYKQISNMKRVEILECFNDVLALKLEPGIYDIDMTVYDKHGNRYKKYLDGALTIE